MITKRLVDWDWTVTKYLDTNIVFQTNIFLITIDIYNKRSSGINSKTSDFPEFVYVTMNTLRAGVQYIRTSISA